MPEKKEIWFAPRTAAGTGRRTDPFAHTLLQGKTEELHAAGIEPITRLMPGEYPVTGRHNGWVPRGSVFGETGATLKLVNPAYAGGKVAVLGTALNASLDGARFENLVIDCNSAALIDAHPTCAIAGLEVFGTGITVRNVTVRAPHGVYAAGHECFALALFCPTGVAADNPHNLIEGCAVLEPSGDYVNAFTFGGTIAAGVEYFIGGALLHCTATGSFAAAVNVAWAGPLAVTGLRTRGCGTVLYTDTGALRGLAVRQGQFLDCAGGGIYLNGCNEALTDSRNIEIEDNHFELRHGHNLGAINVRAQLRSVLGLRVRRNLVSSARNRAAHSLGQPESGRCAHVEEVSPHRVRGAVAEGNLFAPGFDNRWFDNSQAEVWATTAPASYTGGFSSPAY
jgi:hypothetical protein